MDKSTIEGQESVSTSRLQVDRVEHLLREEVAARQGVPGAKLPQERDLAAGYGVNRKTLRQAMDRLKQDNLIESVRGRGTFVVSRPAKSRVVHVLCDSAFHPYDLICAAVVSGLLTERGYSANLISAADPAVECATILNSANESDGAILIGPYSRSALEELVNNSRLPLVHLGDVSERSRGPAVCDNVVGDSVAWAYSAAERLIKRGHRQIALQIWDKDKVWSRDMLRGYQEALEANGIEPCDDWVIDFQSLPFDEQGPKNYLGRLCNSEINRHIDACLEADNMPTAVVHSSYSEMLVYDILHYTFRDLIPREESMPVMFFEMLSRHYTGLRDSEAICFKIKDIAERALELLFRRRNKHMPPRREIVQQLYVCKRENGIWQECHHN